MSTTSPNTTSGQQQKCICQMVQRTTIKWLSYDDICTKLSSTMTILESMNNTTGIGGGGGGSSSLLNIRTNTTTATTIINNNLLGPEPKYILEQQFGLLKKQVQKKQISSSSSSTPTPPNNDVECKNDNDDQCHRKNELKFKTSFLQQMKEYQKKSRFLQQKFIFKTIKRKQQREKKYCDNGQQ